MFQVHQKWESEKISLFYVAKYKMLKQNGIMFSPSYGHIWLISSHSLLCSVPILRQPVSITSPDFYSFLNCSQFPARMLFNCPNFSASVWMMRLSKPVQGMCSFVSDHTIRYESDRFQPNLCAHHLSSQPK